MKPGKKGDPNSYKVRRAKVGGYKDYFDEAQAAEIDEYVRKELSPAFGYDAPTRA
jgi:alcohol sulfotransferase